MRLHNEEEEDDDKDNRDGRGRGQGHLLSSRGHDDHEDDDYVDEEEKEYEHIVRYEVNSVKSKNDDIDGAEHEHDGEV